MTEFSIGVDCTDISRFKDKGEGFLNRLFTVAEIDYCNGRANPAQHFAARFAGKEAIIKALASSGRRIKIQDIEILNDDSGAPVVRLSEDLNGPQCNVRLSLSHSKDIAVAMVLIIWDVDND